MNADDRATPYTSSLEDGVLTFRLNDRETKNALTPALEVAVRAMTAAAVDDPAVRVIVIAGDERVFCSGGTREELDAFARDPAKLSELKPVTYDLVRCPLPTIAAMAGSAVGAGFMLGLACDIQVMAEEARYGANFMDLGFTPGYGATALLEDRFPSVAAELMLTAEYRKGREFTRLGANHVVPAADVENKARDLAARIAEKPRQALIALKRFLAADRAARMETARAREYAMHMLSFSDARERIEDRFLT